MSKRDEVPGLAARLKAARAGKGMTQTQAGEAAGIHQTNLSEFEGGTKTPTLATLYKLAEAYAVNVCDLLPGGIAAGAALPAMAEAEEVPQAEPPAKKQRKPKKK